MRISQSCPKRTAGISRRQIIHFIPESYRKLRSYKEETRPGVIFSGTCIKKHKENPLQHK